MKKEAEAKLRALIETETGKDTKDYSLEADLFMELALDSLEALALLAKIEKRFGIRIPNEELSDTRSLAAILKYIN